MPLVPSDDFEQSRPETHARDFTEGAFRELILITKDHYEFATFGTTCSGPHVLWRHDVDVSVQRARRLAEIESDCSVTATYFFRLHSEFYNLLEPSVLAAAIAIVELGHNVGLHLELDDRLSPTRASIAAQAGYERGILEHYLQRDVTAVSFHNPDIGAVLDYDVDQIAGMQSAYGEGVKKRYRYVSDSNGYWRFARLMDVLASRDEPRIHVLTHPEWWTPEAMPPRDRILRSVYGRAEATVAGYDDLLARCGRTNVR
jgi:hypothetical protein